MPASPGAASGKVVFTSDEAERFRKRARKDNWKSNLHKDPSKYLNSKAKYLDNSISFLKNKNVSFSIQLSGSKEIKQLNKKLENKHKISQICGFFGTPAKLPPPTPPPPGW